MNVSKRFLGIGPLVLALGVAACGGSEPPAAEGPGTPAATPAAAPAAAPSGQPRVFFVEPQNGATVKSPVHLRFGIENYQLGVVPQGTVEVVRQGMGHHHVGVDIDCLPAGSEIPKANPWVHHGGAQTEMDMQLTPGPHRLTLQLGDDKHMTMTGLCQTITVNVVE